MGKLFKERKKKHNTTNPVVDCISCGVTKPLSEFHLRNTVSGNKIIDRRCRPCKNHQIKVCKRLKKVYAEFNTGYCDCCGKNKGKEALVLDHDHSDDTFRGWLCESCNSGIGWLGDDASGLERALRYVNTADIRKNIPTKTLQLFELEEL